MAGVQVVEAVHVPGADFAGWWEAFAAGPSFLLDSALPSERLGRFSFVGGEPFATLRAWRVAGAKPGSNARVRLDVHREVGPTVWSGAPTMERTGGFYELLREVLTAYRCSPPPGPPVPLMAGAVGYLGYEAGQFSEACGGTGTDDLGLPDVHLLLVDAVVAHDHLTDTSYVCAAGWGDAPAEATRRACLRLETVAARLRQHPPRPSPVAAGDAVLAGTPGGDPGGFGGDSSAFLVRAMFDSASYARLVERIKHHLRWGDAYEVCLTHRLESETPVPDPWQVYRTLRTINPAPFASFLSFGEVSVVSSSPERFLSVDRSQRAESRPIKGTRPRGRDAAHDLRLSDSLRSAAKDRAENVMIVDLVRNDFARVCRPGSVQVPELFVVEPYETVLQMVSTVVGDLDDPYDVLDLVRACFPGGSMTGAPKVAAMEIIESLEPVERGVYSGAIGYFDFSGPVDLSIVIRTIVMAKGRCTYSVGGAVVIDSDAHDEFTETMDKAVALQEALRRGVGAGRVDVRVDPTPLLQVAAR